MNQIDRSPEVSIEKEMKKSYLDYAMSVIIGRALPDVRDGLKPVHRRVLYAMGELNNDWNKPYKKSARIVGDVIGKYHPHGDSAVYDTIVRMAQEFSMRYPLIDGQGNFGSIDGDPAAAMRYTEIRMQRLAHEMLADLEKETVDFTPNYDESLSEPSVLPSKIPNLLVNGSAGIAVGMATNIPPHNLGEVVRGAAGADRPPADHLRGADAPHPRPRLPDRRASSTAGRASGRPSPPAAASSGCGPGCRVEKDKRTQAETMVVTELPYQVNKAKLVEKIAELIRDKEIDGIRYVRDESDREGMRIVLDLKKEAMAEVVINQLYKHTRMESTFGIILLAIVNNRPELLNLKEVLEHFVMHRKEIIVRRTRYDLAKAEARAHILEGLKIALDHLDEVVALIRRSASPAEAQAGLMATFALSDIQAQAILDMRLQRLTGLEREKILEEYRSVLQDIARFREILASERLVLQIIKDELGEIQQQYGDAAAAPRSWTRPARSPART